MRVDFLDRLFGSPDRSGRDIASMEGLRGFAVFLVFLVHYSTLVEPWLRPGSFTHVAAETLHDVGNAGVDLFFVLSGYLIYGALITKRRPLLPYFKRRVERIYPTFLAVFSLYLVLSWLLPGHSKIDFGDPLHAMVYVLQNLLLLPGLLPIEPIITVAWSLSYEMFYYLVIPLVIGGLRLRYLSGRVRIALFCACALLAFAGSAWLGMHLRLVMFVCGILLFEALDGRKLPNMYGAGVAALLVGMMSIGLVGASASRFAILFAAFGLLCYDAFCDADGMTARIFSWRPLRWLGNMSYSYYLIHGLALKAALVLFARLVNPEAAWTAGYWLMLPVLFALTLVPAGILYVLVERRFSFRGQVVKLASG